MSCHPYTRIAQHLTWGILQVARGAVSRNWRCPYRRIRLSLTSPDWHLGAVMESPSSWPVALSWLRIEMLVVLGALCVNFYAQCVTVNAIRLSVDNWSGIWTAVTGLRCVTSVKISRFVCSIYWNSWGRWTANVCTRYLFLIENLFKIYRTAIDTK